MNFLMKAADLGYDPAKPVEDVGKRFGIGAEVLLRGMITVFAVLCVIWLCLVLLRLFLHDLPKKRAAKATPAEEEKKAVPSPVSAPAPVTPKADDGELVAVIAAAIAAAEAEEGNGKFRVVSFHRVNKS